jgi:hypothetical protein
LCRCYKASPQEFGEDLVFPYDFDTDPRKVSDFDPIAAEIVGTPKIDKTGLDGWARVLLCVNETISHLQQSIEDNRLSDALFDDAGKPRRELIAQRIIFSIAKILGRLCNVDVVRESNAGPARLIFDSVSEKKIG